MFGHAGRRYRTFNLGYGTLVAVSHRTFPIQYEVTRRGSDPAPPDATYFVLDIVNDVDARVALRFLVNGYRRYGRVVAADVLEKALNETEEAVQRVIALRNSKVKEKVITGRGNKKVKHIQ